MLKKILSVLLMAALVLALAACAAQDNGEDALRSITVTDQAGRSVEINQPVERIVSGYYISSSVCIALGLTDRLVGIEARAETRPIYALAAPGLLALPNVGTAREFNLEGCIALEPDLVILPIRLRDAADTLTEMGIPVVLLNPESMDGVVEMISIIASATDSGAREEELTSWFNNMRSDVQSRAAIISERPNVYIGGVGEYLTTAPGDMFQSSLVELAGGDNVAGDLEAGSWVEISYEQLLAMKPEVIIIPSEAEYTDADITGDPQLSEIEAVKNGRIYKMPSDFEAWDSPVPSAMLGAKWLLSVLHEGIVTEDELQRDIDEYYSQLIG